MSTSDHVLAKQKLILAILAADPTLIHKSFQFRDCLHHIPHYISRLYSRTKTPETSRIRCALRHKCPKCMDPINIESVRRPDFRILAKAARYLGGGELGEDCKVWLLSARLPRPFSGNQLSRLMNRSDSRHRPAMAGEWAGEMSNVASFAGRFMAIVDSNSHKSGALFVFNSLVFSVPEGELDESRLQSLGITVDRFHRRLGAAWQTYLQRWAKAQITECDPTELVHWMTSRIRIFETLGALRGVKSRAQAEHLAKLHESSGKSVRIGFFHRMEQAPEVIDRIDRSLPLNASNLLNQVLSASERACIMSLVKPQVNSVLTPPMDANDLPIESSMTPNELRARLDELREQQERILRALTDDKDSTATRVVNIPRGVN